MISSKDLVLLNAEEAKIALDKIWQEKLDIYIIETSNDLPILLKIGDLEKIRKVIPYRTKIMLEPLIPEPCIGRSRPAIYQGKSEEVGYLDLRIIKPNSLKMSQQQKNLADNLGLSESPYYQKITRMAQQAICDYSAWKKNNTSSKKIMISKHVEPLLKKITTDTREIELLKKILSDFFEELQKN